jgi:hypothetical protein
MEHWDITNMNKYGEFCAGEEEIKIVGTCICNYDLEIDDEYLKIDSEVFCDWECAKEWIRLNFLVEEIK